MNSIDLNNDGFNSPQREERYNELEELLSDAGTSMGDLRPVRPTRNK